MRGHLRESMWHIQGPSNEMINDPVGFWSLEPTIVAVLILLTNKLHGPPDGERRINKDQHLKILTVPRTFSSTYKFGLSVSLFVSNKRQNGWTDRAQILFGTSRDPREGLWMIKISNICFNFHSSFENLENPRIFC